MSVVYSSSLTSSFISTIDHLPADVVRSLWLLQSINIKISKLQAQRNSQIESPQKFKALTDAIMQLSLESVAEAETLKQQLSSHKLVLSREMDLLIAVREKLHTSNQIANKQLRDQLTQHYKEHPLISLKEALKEQARKPSTPKVILKVAKFKRPKNLKKLKVSKLPSPRPFKRVHPEPDVPIAVAVPEILEPELEPEPEKYCFCGQGSFGDMIACDNDKCPNGEWFHYKCVGLLNRVEAMKYTVGKVKWFCSPGCQEEAGKKAKKKKRRRW